jgi:hypothetical protein
VLSGVASVAGAIGAVLLVDVLPGLLPHSLAPAASSFHVALSISCPTHTHGPTGASAIRQIVFTLWVWRRRCSTQRAEAPAYCQPLKPRPTGPLGR